MASEKSVMMAKLIVYSVVSTEYPGMVDAFAAALDKSIASAVAEEREACACAVEATEVIRGGGFYNPDMGEDTLNAAAMLIRARSTQ